MGNSMEYTPEEILSIPPDQLGVGTSIDVTIVPSDVDLYFHMALEMFEEIRRHNEAGQRTVFIVPVGPVGQYVRLAALVNRHRVSCRNVYMINMDEYLVGEGEYIPYDSPFSFRRFMDQDFYELLDPDLTVPPEQRVFPDPHRPEAIQEVIDRAGGVDTCFAGVGITGHLAFNDPPEDERVTAEEFAGLGTRVVRLLRDTCVINAVTAASGNVDAVPRLAVTVGMREILAARRVAVYLNRPWQSAVVRRWIHGPVTARVPASLLQRHPHVTAVMTQEVAALPAGQLR